MGKRGSQGVVLRDCSMYFGLQNKLLEAVSGLYEIDMSQESITSNWRHPRLYCRDSLTSFQARALHKTAYSG